MEWWLLAFFFLGFAILRAIKRGPDPQRIKPTPEQIAAVPSGLRGASIAAAVTLVFLAAMIIAFAR